ncbi:MAG TPA: hypothetical protein VFG30_04995 [Polyangiales bacterium]|nr:hypothetical protein [Polyangiales bacterium]
MIRIRCEDVPCGVGVGVAGPETCKALQFTGASELAVDFECAQVNLGPL